MLVHNGLQLNEVDDYTSKLNLKNEFMNTDKTSLENENQPSCLGAVMGSASFLFPQIVMEQREIELTQDEIEALKNMCLDEQTDWIWSKMTEQEQNWTQGKEWVKSAIDAGYCGFRF